MCSVIVHLHLNRHPLALSLPHPEQPVCTGALCLGFSGVDRERLGEAGVHVKGRRVCHVGRDQTQVDPGRGLIRAPVELREGGADDLPVVVDRGHAPHVAAVGGLIAVGVEAVAAAAVGDRLLAAAQVVHAPEGAGNALTRGVEADLAVHVDVQRILRLSDGCHVVDALARHISVSFAMRMAALSVSFSSSRCRRKWAMSVICS